MNHFKTVMVVCCMNATEAWMSGQFAVRNIAMELTQNWRFCPKSVSLSGTRVGVPENEYGYTG